MRHLDLFAGIGGFSLAANWMGWETIAQVEWDKWCQKVLAKNFPNSLRFGDIVEFNNKLQDGRITTDTEGAGLLREKELENNSENNGTGRGCDSSDIHKIHRENEEIITDTFSNGCEDRYTEARRTERQSEQGRLCELEGSSTQRINIGHIDILTGGFPCQPFSHAGKRKGTDDSRYLWPEMLRTIRILKPSFVVGENVAGLISMDNGKTLDGILSDLENEGYQVESFIIPACAIGAWHRRDRIWIIAYNDLSNRVTISGDKLAGKKFSKLGFCGSDVANSKYKGLEGYNEYDSEQHRQDKRIQSGTEDCGAENKRIITDPLSERGCSRNTQRKYADITIHYSTNKSLTTNTQWTFPDTINTSSTRYGENSRYVSENPESNRFNCISKEWWATEPSVGRVANGIPHRVDRLKGLGNAIVPQVAYQIFKAIEQIA